MTDIIATLEEFAYAIRLDVVAAEDHVLLLDLAEGLVIEELGEIYEPSEWPASAKTVVLAAASRAYFNPEGADSSRIDDYAVSYSAARAGVYLTGEEKTRLYNQIGRVRYSFPGTWPYPDPVEAPTEVLSG